ncbi:hypothetical protein Z946_3209 [Sulfitobacter noctilucicola]|uniref:Uncharacterized protein YjiS (DUF1127 family) n=1 Tax=Sulfitobacter noctilucicola TaxID=1342301 RepID=A0A7W6Q664_9RHOB|nr:DUF1127 domain-containing protein [Sulfitobacter noctilucicola]KIN64318.1 hypothetical protein Z946_3209 [Sulfitobacter noctilucicola]MBB4174517.1 uncharacterized protein YjiS (DUF1127 family) [Sulfitobacter noctilucicola]
MAHNISSVCPAPLASNRPSLLNVLFAAVDVWRSRQQLRSLPAHMLEDIGADRHAAEAEANRPIWDVPAHWVE